MNEMFSLEGRVAWVTGACYGIGMGLAKALARAGARIAINARRAEHVEAALAEYRAQGITAFGRVCDVTDEIAVADFVKSAEAALGPIDILVNNAGMILRVPATEMAVADFRNVVDVDLVGPFICSRAVLPGMVARGRGKIINICSLLSELGRETVSAYAAAKGGLKLLTRALCAEYADKNIQINGIGPGYIATPQTAPLREPGNPMGAFIAARTPAGRWGTPVDLAGPAVFLASDASDFVNGQILYVDGGLLASIGKPQT
jgi:gluconate 5-dehydrogenase